MDEDRWQRLMGLDNPEDVIRESQAMLAETADVNDRASLLTGIHVAYRQLGRTLEARQTLEQMKQLEVSDLEVRMNSDFCEPTTLIAEGRKEAGLEAFDAMLGRDITALKDPQYRYLYEDIQWRRALTLVDLGRFKEALPILREAETFSFADREDEQQRHFLLGICLAEVKNIDQAKQELIRAVRFDMKNSVKEQALYHLAVLYYESGALAQAKHQLEAILRDFPTPCDAIPRKDVYTLLSQTFRYLGDEANQEFYADLAKRA